jgi:Gram-negative bacterial TonB protein C-terminal
MILILRSQLDVGPRQMHRRPRHRWPVWVAILAPMASCSNETETNRTRPASANVELNADKKNVDVDPFPQLASFPAVTKPSISRQLEAWPTDMFQGCGDRIGVFGTVDFSACIAADGSLAKLRVVKIAGHECMTRVSDLPKRWTFTPAFQDGRPVAVCGYLFSIELKSE